MQQSRLIRLLFTLRPPEWRRFEAFVQSPYFNQNAQATQLFAHIRKYNSDPLSPALNNEVVFKRIFGQEPGHLQPLHDLSSYLLRLLEKFLALESVLNQPVLLQHHLSESLLEQERHWYFQKVWDKSREALSHAGESSARHWLDAYQTWEQGLRHAHQAQKRQASLPIEQNLHLAIDALDRFYWIKKLELGCEQVNRSKILNTTDTASAWAGLLNDLETNRAHLLREPLIGLYGQVLRMLLNGSDEDYFQLISRLQDARPKLNPATALALYTYAQNYCIRQINQGNHPFLEELFRIYQTLITEQLLFDEDGTLAHWHYKNITTVALRLKEFDWAGDFLEKYRSRLPVGLQPAVHAYNLAALHYEQGDYHKAMKLLQQTEFADVYYALSAKSMLLKIYYETDDDEALSYAVQAFEVYLRRNEDISKDHQLIHKNLLRYVKKLSRLRERLPVLSHHEREKKIDALLEDMTSTRSVANLSWLQEKCKELRGLV